MLNRVVLIGRLTRDPELRYTQSGTAVASFTLAVDRKYKNASGDREADFIDVVVWRQMAELCNTYLSKGKLCAIDGSLQVRSYEAKDGSRRKTAEVIAEDVRFLSPKTGGGNFAGNVTGAHNNNDYAAPEPLPEEPGAFESNADMVGDDDLPF